MLPAVHPRVTVLIPSFNRAYLIARTIDSVLGQSYANCHALVIDDGSTDGTRELISARYGGNPRVQYAYKPNGGVSSARNLGLSLATGDYIAFLDSDDLWKPWKIELQVACLEKLPGVGMIWTDMDMVDANGNAVRARAVRQRYSAYRDVSVETMFASSRRLSELAPEAADPQGDTRVYWGDAFSMMIMGQLALTSTVLISRERALRVGIFDESMKSGEDYDFHLRTAREGPVAFLDAASTLYRLGAEDQLTHHAYHMMVAENTLKTVQPAIERDRHRIALPGRMLRKRMAAVHEWIGEERLQRRDTAGARRQLLKSLASWPWRKRAWLLLLASCAGPAFTEYARTIRRRLSGHDARG